MVDENLFYNKQKTIHQNDPKQVNHIIMRMQISDNQAAKTKNIRRKSKNYSVRKSVNPWLGKNQYVGFYLI